MTKCAKCRKEIEPGKEVRKGFLWKNAECAPKSYRSEFRSPIILGDYVNQKTLADVIDLLLARKSAFDVDTTVKLMVRYRNRFLGC